MITAGTPNPREVVTRRALIVWVFAVLVYMVAITGRTSFGVAGVDAIERFGIEASRIAVFTAVQVGVYAFSQIPSGMLIDRFGPRKMLVVGAVVMGLGQILLGLTTSYGVAIGARVLIGAGDATAFLSVMRILPYWFPLKKTPLFTQLTASVGQLGQFVSAVPFMALLHVAGWVPAFVGLGAVGILIALAAGVAIADSPDTDAVAMQARADRKVRREAKKFGDTDGLDQLAKQGEHLDAAVAERERTKVWTLLKMVVRSPVCWVGFFIHYTCMLPQIVFTLLWGGADDDPGHGIVLPDRSPGAHRQHHRHRFGRSAARVHLLTDGGASRYRRAGIHSRHRVVLDHFLLL